MRAFQRQTIETDAAGEGAILAALERGYTGCPPASAPESPKHIRELAQALPRFADAVARAEGKPESEVIDLLFEAARGNPYERRRRSVKRVIEYETVTRPDGTVNKTPVVLELVTETVEPAWKHDWRAGLEWLKRRRRGDWETPQTRTWIRNRAYHGEIQARTLGQNR